MAYNVKFLKGSVESYNGLENKDTNTFYYVDGKDLFLGEIKLSNAEDLAAAVLRISTNESDIDKLQEDIKALTGGETGSISGLIEEAVNTAKTELRKEIKANSDAIDAIEADYLKAADKTELANSIKAISDDYLKGSDKTELEGKIKANTDAITVLNGDDTVEGSVAKEVKDAINAFATEVSSNGTIDTFKELVDYVAEHGGDAAEMASAIDALEEKVGEKSVQTQITEAFTAANLDQYATDTELATLTETVNGKAAQSEVTTISGKVTALEGKVDVEKVSTAIEGGVTEAKGYTNTEIGKLGKVYEKVGVAETKANAALADAKLYADGLAGNYDAKGAASAAETAAKTYTNEEIAKLGKVYDAKGAAGTAESNAKLYADGLAKNYDAAGSAAQALTDAKAYANGLAGNYATAEQGTLAASALQKADIATGSANGTISVKGTDVAVKGLGSAAYAATTAFDAAGSASAAQTAAVSTAATDATNKANTAEANAKAYTDTALTWGTI